MRVALYARVSTKDKGQDTENQLVKLREYVDRCGKDGWIVVGEYVDYATGKTNDRDSFKRMFEDARLRKFDLIFFWSLDRFSREGVLETLQHLQKLTSYGVEYKSYSEQYLDSLGIFKEAILGILATIAKQERIRLSERTIAGLERVKREGSKSGNPIGRPRMIVDRVKIRVMKAEGKSLREIGKMVGISAASVMRIVNNRANAS